jgi:fused signal recognition particle receptor
VFKPFTRLAQAVSETSRSLIGRMSQTVAPGQPLDDDTIELLEETLIRADAGVDTAVRIADALRANRTANWKTFLHDEFARILSPFEAANHLRFEPGKQNIYLIVGVNGSGKTTTIGKLAHRFVQDGRRVVIGAGDTFRAAAEDQLAIWAQRAGAELVRQDGADPAAVIFDTLRQGENADVVLLDTAGRLQNKFNLMEELRKIRRVIDKERQPDSVLEVLLVVDANTGQNALKQAEVFKEAVDVNGVVLTKLDGSAKGGIVLAMAETYQLPVKLVGLGEGIDDLREFDAKAFVEALFGGIA